MKKKALGRGLGSLLSKQDLETNEPSLLQNIPIDLIDRSPYQPRREFDEQALDELSQSIQHQGLLQPIVVRQIDQRYELIAGERRWRAAQRAQFTVLPAMVRVDVDNEQAGALALIENLQREDLNAIEQAIALNNLRQNFDLTHEEVAKAVGKSRTSVTNLIRLLNLTSEVQTLLEHGDLDMGHARALLAAPSNIQTTLADEIIGRGMSVRQAEDFIRKAMSSSKAKITTADPDVERLTNCLAEQVGLPVKLKQNKQGRGHVSFAYSSLDELDGLLDKLGIKH